MYKSFLKRFFDIIISLAGAIITLPLFLIIAIAIIIDDPGPVFYKQKRVGKNKKLFWLHKFRSMKVKTPELPTHLLSDPEQYITKVGRFLRKTSLDELPQIYDILFGKIALIGPRPALWNQDDLIAERDKYGVNEIKPGLTGWAQINGRDELEIPVKAKFDGEYTAQLNRGRFHGFAMDVKCFFGTIKSVLKHEGVVEGGTGQLEKQKAEQENEQEKPLKILVVCQYYYPEPFRITDICEEMVSRGHDVTVITGIPNYPKGEIYEGYEKKQRRDEVINGVKVHRCHTVPRKKGAIKRVLNYYSFARSSKRYAARIKEQFDVVFVNQLSPVMMAEAGIAYKKKHGKKLVLYCLDLWPESLTAGGISRKSFIYKHFHKKSAKIYKQADRILVSSPAFIDYFVSQFGISEDKIEYLPQYAETLFTPEMCAKQPSDTVDITFAGNVGAAQSIETIIHAAAKTADIAALRWHIVGDGSQLENAKALAEKLSVKSVVFHGRQPLEKMPEYYAMSDAMLVTMTADSFISMTLPGKVQTYMAAGKPIIGAADGAVNTVITQSGCGFCATAGDSDGLAECVRKFIDCEDKATLGAAAYRYYIEHFEKSAVMDKLTEELKKFCE